MALRYGGRVHSDIEIKAAPLTVQQKEEQLAKLAQELYEEIRYVRPMYPWVLVRVLDREQKIGSIHIPQGTKQNKPVLEGIVLATWATNIKCIRAPEPHGAFVEITSELEPGQHVLFPHWAGVPVVGFAEDKYRLVKERDWGKDNEGGVLGVVEYGDAACMPIATLKGMLAELYPADEAVGGHAAAEVAADRIETRFVLIDQNQKSVTLSGK